VKKENIYIATNKGHNQKIKECQYSLKLPAGNFLFEPEGKNTLAPIAVLSQKINNRDPDAVVVVLPSDHFIKDVKRFVKLLRQGIAISKKGYIVTLGIKTTRPETGYGYIRAKVKAKVKVKNKILRFFKVDKFIEKPTLTKAKKLISDKSYFWNSGVFIFRASIMLEEIKRFTPQAYNTIMRMDKQRNFNKLWRTLPSVSIDYAIMEKTDKAVVLPADCGWTDLGSWQSLTEVIATDSQGNIFRGNCLDLESKTTFVWAGDRLVATLGLKDVVVVDTKDALLVCAKDKTQDVKRIVQLLKQKNLKRQI
jgi:mannose-1-phosphate guanylyltransferase/mannose-6-phosphate isomerase